MHHRCNRVLVGLLLLLGGSQQSAAAPADAPVGVASASASASSPQHACKAIPGDHGWPNSAEWSRLNASVSGRLISTQPVARVCHEPSYSQQECDVLRARWGDPGLQVSQPAEFLAPWFQNQTCVPFTAQSTPCDLGNYASYSIAVSSAQDVAEGLRFAKHHNVRLSVKNTGHDLLGKSTGKGALSLWTHNLKSLSLVANYSSKAYRGPALKAGAGVQGGEAGRFAAERGYRVVIGLCPTVGITGGFTQGGGFSLLSGMYGLGADNVLEWEVVTPDGNHVVATPDNKHADLYWALSGGGGGTYGVVLSMTVRVFEDKPVAAASFFVSSAVAGLAADEYWAAVAVFHEQLQLLVDTHGISAAYGIANDTLIVYSLLAPNGSTPEQLSTLLEPMVAELGRVGAGQLTPPLLGLSVASNSSYLGYYSQALEPMLAVGSLNPAVAGRFLSRANIADNGDAVTAALRRTTEGGRFTVVCESASVGSARSAVAANAAQRHFRDMLSKCIIGGAWAWQSQAQPAGPEAAWAEAGRLQDELQGEIMPMLEAATPGAGAYLNEASWMQVNWQHEFYGDNWARLSALKCRFDPHGLLYGVTAVGSEAWVQDSEGRLCRA